MANVTIGVPPITSMVTPYVIQGIDDRGQKVEWRAAVLQGRFGPWARRL